MAIGLSKDGKWVFNKACTTPWCHAVVHFEVKTSGGGLHEMGKGSVRAVIASEGYLSTTNSDCTICTCMIAYL